jgi:hypothetical protein
VVQLAVVENDESRIPGQIGPHVVVARRIPELVDDKVIAVATMLPDEIMDAIYA